MTRNEYTSIHDMWYAIYNRPPDKQPRLFLARIALPAGIYTMTPRHDESVHIWFSMHAGVPCFKVTLEPIGADTPDAARQTMILTDEDIERLWVWEEGTGVSHVAFGAAE